MLVGNKNSLWGKGFIQATGTNTLIGGIGATTTTVSALAILLDIPENTIENFMISNNDIHCFINANYTIPSETFLNNLEITSFWDYDGKVTEINENIVGSSFDVTAINGNITHLYFPNCVAVNGGRNFVGQIKLQVVYMPSCIKLGNTTGQNYNFGYTDFSNTKIYVNPFLETCNVGSPDGDLLASGHGAIYPTYVTDFTAPNAITDLTIGNVFGTAIQLNFTVPTSVNGIDFYKVYVNGGLHSTINASGDYVIGLSLNTIYSIEVKPIDIFYNRSTSNIVVQSTAATLFYQDYLVSYYKMEGNVLDSWKNNNGIATAITYASGLVGQASVFNGTTSFINVPDADNLSFGNGTTDSPFSFVGIISKDTTANGFLFAKRNASFSEYQFGYVSGQFRFRLFSGGSTASYLYFDHTYTLTTGVNYIYQLTYDGAGVIKFYINNVLQSISVLETGTYIAMQNTTASLQFGSVLSANYLDGTQDEIAIFNTELTLSEVSDTYTKLSSGQSLI